MEVTLQSRAEQLAREMASQATTIEDLNGLLRTMMKSALERMLDTEMDVHLGRRPLAQSAEIGLAAPRAGRLRIVRLLCENIRDGTHPAQFLSKVMSKAC